MFNLLRPHILIEPAYLARSAISKSFGQSERMNFCHSPRAENFTANAIAKLNLALQEQDTRTSLSHGTSERGTSNAATDDDEIVRVGAGHTASGAELFLIKAGNFKREGRRKLRSEHATRSCLERALVLHFFWKTP